MDASGFPRKRATTGLRTQIPEDERDYYLERRYPSFGNLVPRDVASRAAKEVCDEGRGVGPGGQGVYLDFADAIKRLGAERWSAKNTATCFDMYEEITGENAYKVPMRIYPAPHYTMGGLWVDYQLMSTIPGLFVAGEANFSDHGANRLGASALMQGLADGYFILPYTVPNYIASNSLEKVDTSHPAFAEVKQDVVKHVQRDHEYRRQAHGGFDPQRARQADVGKLRHGALGDKSLRAQSAKIPALREEFWNNLEIVGTGEELNQSLEKAGAWRIFWNSAS